ncbi:MAG: putative addiction module antidote protein [Helicobacteraceae bacterium]|nr:putative addiction module antidote protein [Helicobacteraceae bacterium]
MSNKLANFDIAHYLDSKEMIAEYLSQVLSEGDMDELLAAIGNIAKAKGMTQIAKDTGLGRESLYKTFSEGSKPKFETVMKVLHSFGVKLKATA